MNKKVLLSVAVALACVGLGLGSLQGSTVGKVEKFADLKESRDRTQAYGVLDKESIRPLKGATLVRFDLVEEKTGERLEVLYDNPASGLPANFPTASHAQVTGMYDKLSNQFVASSVMTKCPSKYTEENQLDAATQSSLEKWQKATAQKPGAGS